MLKDLFINAAILISSISLGNALLQKILCSSPKLYKRVLTGLLCGALGCILMIFSVNVAPDIIIDFRYIPILIMVFYGSLSSVLATSLTIGIFRIAYFGLNDASVTAFIIALIVGLGCFLITRLNLKTWMKWALAVIFICVSVSLGLILLMYSSPRLISVIIYCFAAMPIANFAVYHYLKFLTNINAAYEKAAEESQVDFLTGLCNRRHCDNSLITQLNNAKEKQTELSYLFIDIDDFKNVNDSYGHLAGDKVLKNIAALLLNECRSLDIVCRYGGEEFTVILVDCGLSKANNVAERIRNSIQRFEHKLDSGESITVSVSIGISSFPTTSAEEEILIKHADGALYEAKRSGKNVVKTALLNS